MKIKELRSLGPNELNDKLEETRKELMKLNSQVAAGTSPKNPGQLKQYKKTVAKILALQKEKEKTKK